MIEGHWFTTIGMSPYAVYNTLWMAYLEHDWFPVRITVFRLTPTSSKPGIKERLDSSYDHFEKWLKRFTTQYNLKTKLETIHCDEENYEYYADLYRKALRDSDGNPRAIDSRDYPLDTESSWNIKCAYSPESMYSRIRDT